jgi:hypothetical protein
VLPQRRDHVDPGQQIVVDPDPQLGDPVDQAIGGGRLDVGDEDDRARRHLVGLLNHTADALQLAQQLAEAVRTPGVDRRAEPQHRPIFAMAPASNRDAGAGCGQEARPSGPSASL